MTDARDGEAIKTDAPNAVVGPSAAESRGHFCSSECLARASRTADVAYASICMRESYPKGGKTPQQHALETVGRYSWQFGSYWGASSLLPLMTRGCLWLRVETEAQGVGVEIQGQSPDTPLHQLSPLHSFYQAIL